jgi:hypothetical protein
VRIAVVPVRDQRVIEADDLHATASWRARPRSMVSTYSA